MHFQTPHLYLSPLLMLLLLSTAQSLVFPTYTYKSHPLHTTPNIHNLPKPPTPVIMRKYHKILSFPKSNRTFHSTSTMLYTPSAPITLHDRRTSTPYISNLDLLLTGNLGTAPNNSSVSVLSVHLNAPARVILLFSMRKISCHLDRLNHISGLDHASTGLKWDHLIPLRAPHSAGLRIRSSDKSEKWHRLGQEFASVEAVLPHNQVLRLPHPSFIKVNGASVLRYTLLFAQVTQGKPMPFPYPSVPSRVKQLVSGKIVTTKMVRANAMCPPWLHDLYMTKSRDVVVAKKMKELKYWRTWHAPIDPVYWCYFGHEHGSFPGFYQPMFDYTAWKTKDADTDHGRQEESHEGFKVFSFPIESEGKFVVVIVHMHVSSERRFETGRHTVSFAVLDDGWDMLMELHMKMDFGGAQATIVKKEKGSKKKKKITIAVNEHEEKKINILRLRGRKAGRRFNVLNITEKYPASVNQTFLLNCGITPTAKNEHQVLKGIYEQWKGPLNTCMGTSPAENLLRGFTFDIRNPSTAMRSIDKPTTKQNMQMLSGSSMDRFLEISKRQGTLEVGIEHCHFDAFTSDAAIMLQKNLGVFYTDSFFTSVRDGPGKFSIRQFISPSFRSMRIPAGRITPSEMWWGHMAYQEGKKVVGRVAVNHENAVKANIN